MVDPRPPEPTTTHVMADPDQDGFFGEFGGRFVPEPLMGACQEVERAFREAWASDAFRAELLGRSLLGAPRLFARLSGGSGRLSSSYGAGRRRPGPATGC